MSTNARCRIRFAFLLLAGFGAAGGVFAGICPLPGGGAISGRVTAAASGDPIAGAQVLAERVVDGSLTILDGTLTGPTGHYQFAALAPGDYFVRTQLTESLVDEIWPDTECDQACDPQSAGTTVPVAAGQSVEEIDFALAAGGRLEGVVRLADGVTPAPGARVEVYALGSPGIYHLGEVLAGADGAWFFEGLESRSYKVRARAPGLLAEVYPDALCPLICDVSGVGEAIAVTAGTTTSGIDVALGAGGAVSGTVTDLAMTPLEGVFVSVQAAIGFGSVLTRTDANGDWIASVGLPAGTYYARTASDHRDELWDDLPCEPFCTVTSGTPIEVGAVPVTGIDFALARLGAVSGTVVESGTGVPLAGASVVARSGGGSGFALTASDGSYRIGGLAADSYLVVALDGVHAGEIYDDAGSCYDPFNCFPSGTATLVDVVGAAETTEIDFELDPGGVLSGAVVVAATNEPVFGATIFVDRLDSTLETFTYSDWNGRFRISGMPAGVSYRVEAEPFPGVSLLAEVWEEQPCVPGSCDLDAGTPVPVGLGAPACVTFTLNGVPDSGGIAGLVTGESGPLSGIQISIFDASGTGMGSVQSDGSGAYLTSGALDLPAGTYYVRAIGTANYAGELYDDLSCDPTCTVTAGSPVVVAEGATTGGIDFELELVPDPPPPPMPLIFLEDCKPGGCVYFRGFESSINNSSSIIGPISVSLPEFSYPTDFWNDLVACVRRAYRPFDVEIIDVDPGAVPHLEHVVAGLSQHLGFPSGVGGVSPFSCGFIPNSISFTFAAAYGGVPDPETLDEICWTVVHEIGHQHGLDHHAYVPDAMTYAEGCGPKRLPARDVPCGELTPEGCVCGGASENSYQRVRDVHGASDLLLEDGFEIVEPGENCGWSSEVPPPVPFAEPATPDAPAAPRCGALEPSNPGFRPQPRSPR